MGGAGTGEVAGPVGAAGAVGVAMVEVATEGAACVEASGAAGAVGTSGRGSPRAPAEVLSNLLWSRRWSSLIARGYQATVAGAVGNDTPRPGGNDTRGRWLALDSPSSLKPGGRPTTCRDRPSAGGDPCRRLGLVRSGAAEQGSVVDGDLVFQPRPLHPAGKLFPGLAETCHQQIMRPLG